MVIWKIWYFCYEIIVWYSYNKM